MLCKQCNKPLDEANSPIKIEFIKKAYCSAKCWQSRYNNWCFEQLIIKQQQDVKVVPQEQNQD